MSELPQKLIVPLSGLSDKAARIETLSNEYKEHLTAAQDRYEKALEANVTGESENPQLRLVVIEQNAAILCQQEMLMLLTSAILTNLMDSGDEEQPQPAPTGGLAS